MRVLSWMLLGAVVVAAGGCKRNNEAWTLRDVRTRGALDAGCNQEQTVVVELGRNNYAVIGCGLSQTYVCRGGACSTDGERRALAPDDVLLGVNGEVDYLVRLIPTPLQRAIEACGPIGGGSMVLVEVEPAKSTMQLSLEGTYAGNARCFRRVSAGRVADLRSTRRYWFYFDPHATQQPVTARPAVAAAPTVQWYPTSPPAPVVQAPVDPAFVQAVHAVLDAQAGDLTACSAEPRLVVEVVAGPGITPTLGLTGPLSGTPEEACARGAVNLSNLPQPTSTQRVVHLLRPPSDPASTP